MTQTLGGIIDGQVGLVRCSEQRVWSLIFAFEYVLSHKVSVELVQRLLGHAMVVCTINRCGMPIFRRLYDFVHSNSQPRIDLQYWSRRNAQFLSVFYHCSLRT